MEIIKKENFLRGLNKYQVRREGEPGGPLESVLVDPTGRNLMELGQLVEVLNSRLSGRVRKLSAGCGVENS